MNEDPLKSDSLFTVPQALNQSQNFEEFLDDILDMTLKVFKVDAVNPYL